jgi:hypothetical protein
MTEDCDQCGTMRKPLGVQVQTITPLFWLCIHCGHATPNRKLSGETYRNVNPLRATTKRCDPQTFKVTPFSPTQKLDRQTLTR